jgi:cellulose synthase/poly-beta-1,6-N-acetylglucosamine synthase-like glycosyltransferase
MTIFIIVLFGSYGLFVLALLFGWARMMDQEVPTSKTFSNITVVVPFRNEQSNLPLLLRDLVQINYPTNCWQVLLVNDHSNDDSVEIVKEFAIDNPQLTLVDLVHASGKKAALQLGVDLANGKIVVTTDSDCRVPPNWLLSINDRLADAETKLAIGPVKMAEDRSLLSRMQALEFASVVGVGGATMGLGFPTMCNGANLAFLKESFVEVGGYQGNEHISSGDDEFLMRKVASRWPHGVRFLNSDKALITTAAASTLTEFINQRLRWAGKWRYNSDFRTRWMAVIVILFHLGFIGAFFSGLAGWLEWRLLIILFGGRFFVEALFLMAVGRFLALRWSWVGFILLQFVYSLYVVSIGLASQFVTVDWKGRSVKARG